jgi:hypothetical protein
VISFPGHDISGGLDMIRTLISLDPEDKEWLDRRAQEEGVTMTQIVRTAVRRYREQCEAAEPSLQEALRRTSGIWTSGDGLEYQRQVRDEWEGDPEAPETTP